MTEDDTTDESEEHSEPEPDDDGLPDIESDQQADLDGLDLSGADLDPNDSDDGEGADSDGDDPGDDSGGDTSSSRSTRPSGKRAGDLYVQALAATTTSITKKHGDGEEFDEEYFRQFGLDDSFDDVMQKYTGGSDLPPEKALVVGTLVAVAGPVAVHTDLFSDAVEEVRAEADGGEADA